MKAVLRAEVRPRPGMHTAESFEDPSYSGKRSRKWRKLQYAEWFLGSESGGRKTELLWSSGASG
eukprot:6194310-Pleurochrysis_carterae.AAC.8